MALGGEFMARIGASLRLGVLAAMLGVAFLLLAGTHDAKAQLTTNVYKRVLLLRVGNETATGFTLDLDGRQYLITAKHVVAALGEKGTLGIFKNGGWQQVAVTIFRCAEPVDIAVLIPPAPLTESPPLEPTSKTLRYGEEMYFAGFPYGLRSSAPALSGGYPVAFVKKATMSGEVNENGTAMFVLDGYNNPGFSGGPLVYRDAARPGFVYDVAGVVKGFRADLAPVYKREPVTPDQITADDIAKDRIVHTNSGRTLRLTDTGEVVKLNSDLLIAYNISYAIALIRKNPVGPEIADTAKP
ncbi:MAG TPA: serine protease [Stellaceae bacterium]|nr:serine protease [Stellaceae bacterium]